MGTQYVLSFYYSDIYLETYFIASIEYKNCASYDIIKHSLLVSNFIGINLMSAALNLSEVYFNFNWNSS